MRYIGSKTASLPIIAEAIHKVGVQCRSLCDPFAGTCTVPRFFKKRGVRVLTGDVLVLSYVFQMAYLKLNRPPTFRPLGRELAFRAGTARPSNYLAVIDHLNSLPGTAGFVTSHYSPAGPEGRMFFLPENAARIDAIRDTIREWTGAGLITREGRAYLLACLLEAADRVANTAGTYYAFLKSFYRKARQPLRLKPLDIVSNGLKNRAAKMDARDLVANADVDVLYLDPPYNERDYGAYYHLPETLVRWDKPEVDGMCGIRADSGPRSHFCRKATAGQAFSTLVARANAGCIVLHYAAEGLVPHRTILRILRGYGTTTWTKWEVRAYSSHQNDDRYRSCSHRLYVCTGKRPVVCYAS